MLTRTFLPTDLELRGDGRTVVGIAAPFNAPTTITERGMTFTEIIRPGAFTRTINERGAQRVKLLAQHDTARLPLGRANVLRETTSGLYIEARVSQTAAGDEALELVRDGALDAFSIGFTVTTNGDRWDHHNSVRELIDVKLHEVSLTPFPAYQTALVAGVRTTTPYSPESDPEALTRRVALLALSLRRHHHVQDH